MVPDKFNMVDMGGIDLILMQGEEVPGLYNRLVESITQCRYQCLYNWLFDGVIIPPTYVEMEVGLDEEVRINEGVVVTSDDVIHIYSVDPPAPEPEIVPLLAEENGTYNVPTGVDGFNHVTVDVPSYTPVINPITITENGIYNAPVGVDGYSPVTVNVPDTGSGLQGFELYGAGFGGGTQTFTGKIDNVYLSCCFHDNMSPDYVLNGVTERFSASCTGRGNAMIYATTKAVSNNIPVGLNAMFEHLGSLLQSSHYDAGSYMSVVGGWVGYPTGGTIYENAVPNAAQNTIVMNSAHQKLLVFIAGSAAGLTGTTVDINGITYNITNMGTKYDSVYSAYAAIEINNNTDTTITVTFPSTCYNYVSIIGIDN